MSTIEIDIEENNINYLKEVIGVSSMTPLSTSINCDDSLDIDTVASQVSKPVTDIVTSTPKSVDKDVSDGITSLCDESLDNCVSSQIVTTPSRKRKLTEDDTICLRKKICDNHVSKVSQKVCEYAERCSLRCYLNLGGTPAEYSNWRKVIPDLLISNLEENRLDLKDNDQLYNALCELTPSAREIVQKRRALQAQAKNKVVTSTPKAKVVVNKPKVVVKSAEKKVENEINQELIAERAKQEAHVMQRISELQKDGLWAEKRLHKVNEPPRPKAHWDFLLEEMVWLSADFAQERKWKKACAKKCAKMVQKYFSEKESTAQKAVKAKEAQLRKIASIMAKEVRQFWTNIEKLVEFKQQTKIEEKRKKALDQHLSFIVEKTEKYSSLVAESLNDTSAMNSKQTTPKGSDDEFEPDEGSSDDEETIAKEEAMSKKDKQAINEEINALQKESELPLDELLSDYLAKRDELPVDESSSEESEESESDDEFNISSSDESDDEETIAKEEEIEQVTNYNEEINELEADNNLSIEELKLKYKIKPSSVVIKSLTNGDMEVDSDKASEESESELKKLIDDKKVKSENSDEDSENEMNNVAALAQSLQPKGNTLSSTNVVTKVPFLLKHTLREYQHIGLDWLVTMYERTLNGILADEMGLGKTIQTIALLAHLACEKGNWGPHLIVVPTSVMLNWEMEFKKWCPSFKILTYYGSIKERKYKRIGWTKPNTFHICITSYKLIIQDHASFRRKKWKYLILDEAQNIKNFKSQRWQLLLNFQTQRRLLLTGTPLQNNLMELWSLMHFLMPSIFESHREFKEWFSNPVTGMIEGNAEYNENIIRRLHKVLRPFLLRRLKSEVETQMPKKYEHVVICRLSNRQRYLYDDFMSRAKTREMLASGNMLSVINVLMQLRKVCNHPNLFEVRPTVSPFHMEGMKFETAFLVTTALDYDPFKHVDLACLSLNLLELEGWLAAFVIHRAKRYKTPKKLIEEIDDVQPVVPACPKGKVKISVQWKSQVAPPPSPNISVVKPTFLQLSNNNNKLVLTNSTNPKTPQMLTLKVANNQQNVLQIIQKNAAVQSRFTLVNTPQGKQLVITPQPLLRSNLVMAGGQRLTILPRPGAITNVRPVFRLIPPLNSLPTINTSPTIKIVNKNVVNIVNKVENLESKESPKENPVKNNVINVSNKNEKCETTATPPRTTRSSTAKSPEKLQVPSPLKRDERIENIRRVRRKEKLELLNRMNERRCNHVPIYGTDIIQSLTVDNKFKQSNWRWSGCCLCTDVKSKKRFKTNVLSSCVFDFEERLNQLNQLISRFVMYVPAAFAPSIEMNVSRHTPWKVQQEIALENKLEEFVVPLRRMLHPVSSAMQTQFPDRRLIQYDCGKLQSLDALLRRLKDDKHRVLLFTQMTRMLDVLEDFLNFHGHIYLRLDGTTKVEQRQVLMERFNNDKRIFVFILSTRSGGVGVNLTGADTVIFYDSDWNPTMDAQAQDRCHRIGQTRDVNIYRLISEKTIEENILKKANQKRMLGDLAIEGGNFTTAYFKSSTIQDLFNVDVTENDASRRMEVLLKDSKDPEEDKNQAAAAFESALAQAEDESDVAATKVVQAETAEELAEFDENIPIETQESEQQLSKAELELQALEQQLSGVEKYAMKFIEETEASWAAEQMALAEAQLEEVKRNWEQSRTEDIRKSCD